MEEASGLSPSHLLAYLKKSDESVCSPEGQVWHVVQKDRARRRHGQSCAAPLSPADSTAVRHSSHPEHRAREPRGRREDGERSQEGETLQKRLEDASRQRGDRQEGSEPGGQFLIRAVEGVEGAEEGGER